MEAEIAELRQQRGVFKRQMTLAEQWQRDLATVATSFDYETRLVHIDKVAEQFASVQGQLEAIDPTECKEEDDVTKSERELFDERYLCLRGKMLSRRHSLSGNVVTTDPNGSSQLHVDVATANLPEIPLQTFDGDYLQYPAFMDTFKTLVHNSTARGMDEIHKFALLKKHLGPTVQSSLQFLTLSAENYTRCLEALDRRYSRKRLIFERFLSELCSLNRASDTTSLRAVSDGVYGILRAVELLATPTEVKDGLLIHLVLQKCDEQTMAAWEQRIALKSELPKWQEFSDFLDERCVTMESFDFVKREVRKGDSKKDERKDSKGKDGSKGKPATVKSFEASVQESAPCPLCKGSCALFSDCKVFCAKNPKDRFKCCKKEGRCICCLRKNHEGCTAVCGICQKAHHTMLHFPPRNNAAGLVSLAANRVRPMLLATVKLEIIGPGGRSVPCRAMLDGGSQVNFVSHRIASLLHLPTSTESLSVTGVHGQSKTYHKSVEIHFKSCTSDYTGNFVAVISQHLTGLYPSKRLATTDWKMPANLPLADSEFGIPAKIDLILNAGVFYPSLSVGQVSLGPGNPVLQKTLFGWIVAGEVAESTEHSNFSLQALMTRASSEPELDWLEKFWTLEEVAKDAKPWSIQEEECERLFLNTVERTPTGRFVVRLPFSKDPGLLGESFGMAKKRLVSIKSKLRRNSSHSRAYQEFLDEYRQLGHLKVLGDPLQHPNVNLLPHFFVENLHSTTTPLRVVFDASAKTSSGYSLNDVLMVGPAIQPNLIEHLISFRVHEVAVVGDISKMYRQVVVHELDCKFQCILWQEADRDVVMQLSTVTYGTASASYLAQRCLLYLAEAYDDLPLGSEAVKRHFYMDDDLDGDRTVEAAAERFRQTQALVKRGGFELKKLMSNSQELLEMFPNCDRGTMLELDGKGVTTTLGLNWAPIDDNFLYKVQPGGGKITKRVMLSEIARLYDPLGLIQPVIVLAKIAMQYLWTLQLNWEESVPQEVATRWETFREELGTLESITIPRCVVEPNWKHLQFHVFADASEKAYGACIYVRSGKATSTAVCHLLCAKSRVAPLKKISLPRLELCACLLAAELLEVVKKTEAYRPEVIYCWTDSTTALKWVTSSPHRWHTFIANRVTKIQTLTVGCVWRHVPGLLNPADLPSRGVLPRQLVGNTLWWNGPEFLGLPEAEWPEVQPLPADESMPERKEMVHAWATTVEEDPVAACKFQSWQKMKRVFAYCAKFIQCARRRVVPEDEQLTVADINEGMSLMVRFVQQSQFPKVAETLQKGNSVLKSHPLSSLSPFVDDKGIIRVGGRLDHAPMLSFDTRHPIILPRGHVITRSLYLWMHHRLLHAGPTALLASVRQQFWTIGGKAEANKVVSRCIRCYRARPVTFQQVMASLPKERLQLGERCFIITGVDLLGPIKVHYRRRGVHPTNAYIAAFVCFSSKAVHFELVEDLSTNAFMGALRRFVGLRGAPKTMWSDNATNFAGTSNLFKELVSSKHWTEMSNWCRDVHGFEWRFIPPRSPHWGGLWEAAVKSAKYHIIRTVGDASLTVMEWLTVLADVGAVLNSRPIVPITLHPKDKVPLTPGHFLIGGPLVVVPEPSPAPPMTTVSPKERWKLLTSIKQQLSHIFNTVYLQSLQQKFKWTGSRANPQLGQLVLLVEDNAPSYQWALGRIVEMYPGKDGVVRVVKVQQGNSQYKRAVTRLCPVPVDVEAEPDEDPVADLSNTSNIPNDV